MVGSIAKARKQQQGMAPLEENQIAVNLSNIG
jgi:hypothetical protein